MQILQQKTRNFLKIISTIFTALWHRRLKYKRCVRVGTLGEECLNCGTRDFGSARYFTTTLEQPDLEKSGVGHNSETLHLRLWPFHSNRRLISSGI
jgi:hypothetical protein